jgi:aspartokinase
MLTLVSLQADVCFVEVVEGETDDLKRQVCEFAIVDCLRRSGISVANLDINAAGCFFVVRRTDLDRFKAVARDFNVAIKVNEQCCRLTVRGSGYRRTLPSIDHVIKAMHDSNIRIIQIFADASELSIVVDAKQATSAKTIIDHLSLRERDERFLSTAAGRAALTA